MISSASRGCPPSLQLVRPALAPGGFGEHFHFKKYHPGWSAASVSCLLFLLHFPGSPGERAQGLLTGAILCLPISPLMLSNFLTGESQPLLSPWFTCRQSGLRDGRKRWRDWGAKRLWEATWERQKVIFLSTYLRFIGWGPRIK